jgi:hypothetical protein
MSAIRLIHKSQHTLRMQLQALKTEVIGQNLELSLRLSTVDKDMSTIEVFNWPTSMRSRKMETVVFEAGRLLTVYL